MQAPIRSTQKQTSHKEKTRRSGGISNSHCQPVLAESQLPVMADNKKADPGHVKARQKTSAQPKQKSLFAKVCEKIADEQAAATFAIGGSIKIKEAMEIAPQQDTGHPDHDTDISTTSSSSDNESLVTAQTAITSAPVVIRWDSKTFDVAPKIILPLTKDHNAQLSLKDLIQDCSPVSVGNEGKDVYDEEYRKASKLDETEFCTNFCPYALGIIDTIEQRLLPHVDKTLNGVQAELYKLNVYSGPSGKFHAHVDTPREQAQFGSLVVCLPCAHEAGGALVVRHNGRKHTFDWAAEQPTCVQWAAFNSDCEHEVLEVKSGHRITLNYNLCVSTGVGRMAGNSSSMSAAHIPLYAGMKKLLAYDNFLSKGTPGKWHIGIRCSHFYAHAGKKPTHGLPNSLKGIDMAVFEVLLRLGLAPTVQPVLTTEHWHDEEDDFDEDYDGSDDSQEWWCSDEDMDDSTDVYTSDEMTWDRDAGEIKKILTEEDKKQLADAKERAELAREEQFSRRKKRAEDRVKRIREFGKWVEKKRKERIEWEGKTLRLTMGRGLHTFKEIGGISEEEFPMSYWGRTEKPLVTWLTKRPQDIKAGRSVAMRYVAYGNGVGDLGLEYTSAAILARVPDAELRGLK
ncbi:hypothetical protein EJ08DRAFT_631199 [Tothia fuscella]|uniref:Fe2OG dioxygenase domain-containing protein n=1 Tax=Tothia fuscella TaxID=1048955 RepID=A0A9P4NVR0_9PEZI|nr:hypothetical protein EJ08DRAFT_631199 [Tothia fuscella]